MPDPCEKYEIGFWLPDGRVTLPCPVQEIKPLYFKGNDSYPWSYFVNLHHYVSTFNTYNYCGAKLPLAHNGLNIKYWRENLADYHDSELCDFLEFGWPLGIDPSVPLNSTLRNHPSSVQFPDFVDKFIKKQIYSNALVGPCIVNPFQSGICISPLMTVPKKPDGRRIVLDATFGDGPNAATPKGEYLGDSYEFNFPKVDQFTEMIRNLGPGCLLWKRDLRNYFLQLMVNPSDYNKMCLVWRNVLFFFAGMMFGFRNSGLAGQRTTTAVVYIFKKNAEIAFNKQFGALNYSDDLAGAEKGLDAWQAFDFMSVVLKNLGLEESIEKALPPSTNMEYLGIEFDTIAMEKRVTPAKLTELDTALDEWLVKVKATKKELQSILHRLLWVVSCVNNSRVFVSRIISELKRLDKNHHRVSLSDDIRKDFRWFKLFLNTFNGVQLIETNAWPDVDLLENCGDACPEAGGAYVGDQYFSRVFPAFLKDEHIHIKEFHVVLVTVKFWGPRWTGKKVVIRCDNDAVCDTVFYQKPTDPKLQECLRELLYWLCRYNCSVSVQKIGTKDNFVADFLSRYTDEEEISEFFGKNNIPKKTRVSISDSYFQFSGAW